MQARAVTSFSPTDPNQGISQDTNTRPVRAFADRMVGLYGGALTTLESRVSATDLTPGVFVQTDFTGLDSPQCSVTPPPIYKFHLKDGSDWTYMLQRAGPAQASIAEIHTLLPNCGEVVSGDPNGTGGTSIVWAYSYNEWWEGAGIEELSARSPAYPYGFGLAPLQILKQVLP